MTIAAASIKFCDCHIAFTTTTLASDLHICMTMHKAAAPDLHSYIMRRKSAGPVTAVMASSTSQSDAYQMHLQAYLRAERQERKKSW